MPAKEKYVCMEEIQNRTKNDSKYSQLLKLGNNYMTTPYTLLVLNTLKNFHDINSFR